MTKTQLNHEWNTGLEKAIEAEAQAQAICMQTQDFARAHHAFVAKEQPVFGGIEKALHGFDVEACGADIFTKMKAGAGSGLLRAAICDADVSGQGMWGRR